MRVKRLVGVGFALFSLFVASQQVAGAIITEASPKTHYYAVEYLKPVPGSGTLSTLSAMFFVSVSGHQAEAVLRTELGVISRMFPPKGDVLAVAWFSSNGNAGDEKQIDFTDGSPFLIFQKKSGKILTWREYCKQPQAKCLIP
jgi:hypothetical protein